MSPFQPRSVRLRVTDLEFSISGGREEGGAGTITAAIREMYAGVPRAHLVVQSWQSWPDFVKTVGAQDLLMQAPNTVSVKQLRELHIKLDLPKPKVDAPKEPCGSWNAPRYCKLLCDSSGSLGVLVPDAVETVAVVVAVVLAPLVVVTLSVTL